MDVLDRTKYDQISKSIWYAPNVSVDILDRTKYQGPFSTEQVSQWIFYTGPNVLQGLIDTVLEQAN